MLRILTLREYLRLHSSVRAQHVVTRRASHAAIAAIVIIADRSNRFHVCQQNCQQAFRQTAGRHLNTALYGRVIRHFLQCRNIRRSPREQPFEARCGRRENQQRHEHKSNRKHTRLQSHQSAVQAEFRLFTASCAHVGEIRPTPCHQRGKEDDHICGERARIHGLSELTDATIDDFSLLTNLTLPLESVEASSWGMPSDTFAQYENSA